MERIIARIRHHFLHTPIHTSTTTNCDLWEETLVRENGYVFFSDIDYAGQNPAIWDALDHLRRIQAKLIRHGNAAFDDAALMEDIYSALRFWLDRDFQNPNWWYNDIGMPISVTTIALLLHPVLDKPTLARAAEISGRS